MKSLKNSLFGKIFGLAALILFFTGIVALFSHLESSALDELGDVRTMAELKARIQTGTVAFLTRRDTDEAAQVDTDLTAFEAMLQPYQDDEAGAALQATLDAYRTTFAQLVATMEERGLDENSGAEGRLRARVHAVEEVVKASYQDELLIDLLQARRSEKEYFMRRKSKYVDRVRDTVALLLDDTERAWLKRAVKNEIKANAEAYLNDFEVAVSMLGEIDEIEQELLRLQEEAGVNLAALATAKEAKANTMSWIMVLITLLSIAAGPALAYFIARSITRPVKELEEAAARVADGELDVTFDRTSTNEIDHLAASFEDMVGHVKTALEAVEAEKASVEQKVDEVVQAAEAQQAYLTQSVDRMLVQMERFAEGDLTVCLDAQGDDEISRLYKGFNRAVTNMRTLLAQVHQNVEATAGTVKQIGASTEALAAGVQEQSSQATEVAAAVEQMTATIIENARNAQHTADTASANGRAAETGGAVVQKTVDKIREIADIVSTSARTVERLGASSDKIGEIVSVINEIADQTNLLALNAAIEAARAGEQGRGFAVVADEVRKLAERTTSATKEIAAMIKGIQAETVEAVEAMQRGTKEVEEGIRLADQAGTALSEIVEGAQTTVDMIHQIAAASDEQSTTSEDISRSVESISIVSAKSASGIAEIAQAGDGLHRMTDALRALLARFRMDAARLPQPASSYAADRPGQPYRTEAAPVALDQEAEGGSLWD